MTNPSCTREMLLRNAGYQVASVQGFVGAFKECSHGKYDLTLMRHSMPREDKTVLLAAIRNNGNAPVLSIRRRGDPPLQGADYSIESDEGPEVLLAGVRTVLAAKGKA